MKRLRVALLGLLAVFGTRTDVVAQGTAFTYQGRLDDNSNPANGSYDLRFALYDADTGGLVIGEAVTNRAATVSNGLFTVTLDFGSGAFTGPARWLEIGVRTNGSGAFTMLAPRQQIASSPYAIRAVEAGTAATAGIASGVGTNAVGTSALETGAVTSAKIADGTIQSNDLGAALVLSTFWRLDGNAGTTPGAQFLGTTDSRALELKVANDRVFRFEPAPEVPNVIGGSASNSVAPGIRGATIAGGGLPLYPHTVSADYGAIGGGTFHIVSGPWGTIAGGRDNREHSESATIGGGFRNTIQSNSFYATIAGGFANIVSNAANGAVITGGADNQIGTGSPYATISGGTANNILTNSDWSLIAGGGGNVISNSAFASSIGGGSYNMIQAGAYNVIGGGNHNTIYSNSLSAVLAGGFINVIHTNSSYATIGGGKFNNAYGEESTVAGGAFNNALAFSAAIGGGGGHRVESSWSVVAGGRDNVINTNAIYSTIAGGIANRVNEGSVGTIGGGAQNLLANGFGVVAGGVGNTNSAVYGTIGGGRWNTVAGPYGTVAGGLNNSAGGLYSFAAGQAAKATHPGTFVWADAGGGDFNSTTANEFSVRAGGGVRVVTGGAGMTVDGNPVVAGPVNTVEIADHAVTSVKLDEFISLGSAAQAGTLQVTDTAGITRAVFDGGVGEVRVNASTGAERARLTATSGYGQIALFEPGGNFNANLSATAASGGFLRLYNDDGSETVGLFSGSAGVGPSLGVRNNAGNFSVDISGGTTNTGSSMAMRNRSGNITVTVDADNGAGHGSVSIFNTNSITRVFAQGANGSLDVRNELGQVRVAVASGANTNTGGSVVVDNRTGAGTVELIGDNGSGHGAVTVRNTNGVARIFIYGEVGGTARIGVGRTPASNELEVNGDASKSTAGSWLANSDRRIKTDVQRITNALAHLDQVKLVSFRYTDEYRAQNPTIEDRPYVNVVAQEFRKVFPNDVKNGGDKLPNGDSILQVDTYPLTIYSAAAIQELHEQMRQKDQKISALEHRLLALEKRLSAQ